MAYIVDIYGTRTLKFGEFDSDAALLAGYVKGDTIYRDGTIYHATTDIPPGVPFRLADSELDAEAWFTAIVGVNAPIAQAGDSDLWAAIANLAWEMDSDNQITRDDHDSDTAQITHDYKAADSDLKKLVTEGLGEDLDSEILARKEADSDIWVAIANLAWERDSDNIITRADHDSDRLQITHDFRAADSDLLFFVTAGLALDLDSEILARKDADSDFKVAYDSDITTIYHDYQAADSDLFDIITDLEIRHDSDVQRLMEHDSEMVYFQTKGAFFTVTDPNVIVYNLPAGVDRITFITRNGAVITSAFDYQAKQPSTITYNAANNGGYPLIYNDIIRVEYKGV